MNNFNSLKNIFLSSLSMILCSATGCLIACGFVSGVNRALYDYRRDYFE